MRDYIQWELQPLVQGLRARYPHVRIVSASVDTLHDGALQQTVRYQAPLAELKRCGLLTSEMLLLEKRRFSYGTALGEGFHFQRGSDKDSIQGCLDLLIFTGSRPRERPRIAVDDARRELKRIFKTTGWKLA